MGVPSRNGDPRVRKDPRVPHTARRGACTGDAPENYIKNGCRQWRAATTMGRQGAEIKRVAGNGKRGRTRSLHVCPLSKLLQTRRVTVGGRLGLSEP